MGACAIAGHRPTRFKFKYKENNNGCKRLKKRLRDQFILLYEKGVRRFLIGGGLGVDIWSGEILLKMKIEPEYQELELIIVIPFEGHDKAWDDRSRKRLEFLKAHSAEVITASDEPGAESYYRQSQYLLSHADYLLAVFDNDFTVQSSIGKIVSWAVKKQIPVLYIHPDTAKVTF